MTPACAICNAIEGHAHHEDFSGRTKVVLTKWNDDLKLCQLCRTALAKSEERKS
jgi:hypothetical protein